MCDPIRRVNAPQRDGIDGKLGYTLALMPLYLGLDSSTQSLSAIVLEAEGDRRRVVFESSLVFDDTFPHYRTSHGVLPSDDPTTAASPPLLWVEALDLMMARHRRRAASISAGWRRFRDRRSSTAASI